MRDEEKITLALMAARQPSFVFPSFFDSKTWLRKKIRGCYVSCFAGNYIPANPNSSGLCCQGGLTYLTNTKNPFMPILRMEPKLNNGRPNKPILYPDQIVRAGG
jgi:hypothetical protein